MSAQARAQACEDAASRLIRYLDANLGVQYELNEAEKLAALLDAAYAQRQFMLEQGGMLAAAVPIVERFHEETVALVSGAGP